MTPQIRDFINRGMMPLVGREREMRVLLDAFAGLLEGEARAVWMTGTAGAGKSRLLDELKHRAADSPARCMVVHAKWYEGEGLELGPLGNALEVLRPAMAAPVAARVYRDGAIATVDAAVEAVQIASRRYPVIIILDDLHYLGSARELERFIGAIEEIPVLLLCTARPGDNPAPRAFRAALSGSIPPVEIEVGPLDGAGIAEAAEALFGAAPPEGMLEQIADLSGGLPLTMREVFLELIEREHLVADGANDWRWSTPLLGEEALREVGDRVHGFSGRLASLPEHHRLVLGVAAVLGEQFNRDLLRAVCERTVGWDDHAFEHLILKSFIALSTPSVRLGLRDGEGRVCFAFLHTLLWKATLASSGAGPTHEEIGAATLDALTRGTGELYNVAPLENAASATPREAEGQRRLLRWIVGVGARLNAIYSESFAALCAAVLDPLRRVISETELSDSLVPLYLSALTAYGERLHTIGARERLEGVAGEIARCIEARPASEPADPERRVVLLEAAVVVWKNALLRGEHEQGMGFLDKLFAALPPPAEQSDRELRGAAEALRLLLDNPYRRGEFAGGLQHVAPYIGEMDRMPPEVLAALLPVLIPALHRAGRAYEANEVIEAALRLRHSADIITELGILRWAAIHALTSVDIKSARRYTVEHRQVAERFPPYRYDIRPFQYLSSVAALEGNEEELDALEQEFRATPHIPITTRDTLIGVALRFQIGWNILGRPERARAVAATWLDVKELSSALHRYTVLREHLRSAIDAADREQIAEALALFTGQVERMGEAYATPGTDRYHEITLLCAVARSTVGGTPEPITTWLKEHDDPEQIDDASDGMRAALFLLTTAETASAGERRGLCDSAYNIIDILMTRLPHPDNQLPALAHHMLDRLAPHLPKTRLMRFRQMVGEDPRRTRDAKEKGETATPATEGAERGRTVRTFGALRVEGTQEVGAKLESKTRVLVAALVVSRLGDNRALGKLTRDRFADLLWPDMPLEKAVNNLHANLSYARRFLGGPTTILQTDGVYSLGGDVAIDAVEFRENIRRGNRLYNEGVYFGAAVAYRHAIERAQGDFLEGMYAEWVDTLRETLRGELATAIERLMALEIDRENFTAVPPLAEQLLALDDLHDGAYEALIRSAAARGARREAFTWYKRYEAALDAYDARPTRRIAELMERVRSGETVAGEEIEEQ